MKRTVLKSALLALLGTSWVASSAVAHHSYAMFDRTKTATVTGTMAKVEWSNPHVFFWVYVLKANGNGYDAWGFEAGGVGSLMRRGWTKYTLKAGDKVSIEYNPVKNGTIGGAFRSATLADGTVLSEDSLAAKKEGAN